MKKCTCIYSILVITALITILSSCKTTQKKSENVRSNYSRLAGSWRADEKLRYVFSNDGFVTVYMGEQIMGGSDLFGNSILKYEIDFSKKPIRLDLVHFDKSNNKEKGRMAMIVEFLTDNKIKIKTFNNSTYPETFEENDKFVFELNREINTDNNEINEKE